MIMWRARFFLMSGILIYCLTFPGILMADGRTNNSMSDDEYSQRLKAQTIYHQLRMQGNALMEKGQNEGALEFHLKAFELAKGSSVEAASRYQLMQLFEKTGQYDKALENVEWFLSRADKDSPFNKEDQATKERLLKKITSKKRVQP